TSSSRAKAGAAWRRLCCGAFRFRSSDEFHERTKFSSSRADATFSQARVFTFRRALCGGEPKQRRGLRAVVSAHERAFGVRASHAAQSQETENFRRSDQTSIRRAGNF